MQFGGPSIKPLRDSKPPVIRIRGDVAADYDVAASGKLTMIARPNQIAEEKAGDKSV